MAMLPNGPLGPKLISMLSLPTQWGSCTSACRLRTTAWGFRWSVWSSMLWACIQQNWASCFCHQYVLGLVIGGWGGCLAAFYLVGVSRLRCSESWDCPSEDGVLVCSSLFGGTSFGAGGVGLEVTCSRVVSPSH
jgi:hypothetical protein